MRRKITLSIDEKLIQEFRRRYGDRSISSVLNFLLWQKIRDKRIIKAEREQLLIKLDSTNKELGISGLKEEIESFVKIANMVYTNSKDSKKEETLGLLSNLFLMVFQSNILGDNLRSSIKSGYVSDYLLNKAKESDYVIDMRW